jgi:small subunit ribosomal protein S13
MSEKTSEKKQDKIDRQEKQDKKNLEKAKSRKPEQEDLGEVLVRILGYDIPGSKNVFSGITRIKGVSWAISNATCIKLNIPKSKKISELTKADIQKIESFLKEMPIPDYMKNRRFDRETGETKHYLTSDLDIRREFDIKRLKEIKSYKGLRHAQKLPVRGQRTRSHFRSKGVAMGVKRKAK